MKIRQTILIVSIAMVLAVAPDGAGSQSLALDADSSAGSAIVAPALPVSNYIRPTQRTNVANYVFDAFGPYPVVGGAFAAGINQWSNSPPEWKQGAEGFGKRFGSDFGMAAVGTTTRYALSEAFKEDTLYYRCECKGILPRISHAVVSTLTARRGLDGHRAFSVSAFLAPYAGSTTAVYGWYPARFGAKDAFRMGNYNLLAYMGGNVALEFMYSGPHSLLSRMHLNNLHGSPDPGPNH